MSFVLQGVGAHFRSVKVTHSSPYHGNFRTDTCLRLRARSFSSHELECSHFESCSGCTLQTNLLKPSARTSAEDYFSSLGLHFTFHAASLRAWRQRARLAVQQGLEGRAVIGLFQQRSHIAVDIPKCVAHVEVINQAVDIVRKCLITCNVSIYDEVSGTGDLRYLQLTAVQSIQTDRACIPAVQVVLVWNASPEATLPTERLRTLADSIYAEAGIDSATSGRRSQNGALIQSIWANFQPKRTNTILASASENWSLLHGYEHAWVRLGGADICFAPGSFLQANFEAMDQCLTVIQSIVPKSATVVDLHAGVGTIGLSLAATREPYWVRFVEINPLAEVPFWRSAARLADSWKVSKVNEESCNNNTSLATRDQLPQLEFHVAAAGSDPGRWLDGAEIVIVDPPRKGLEPLLIQYLSSKEALNRHPDLRKLLYLSCGFSSFMRDCDQLLASNQWQIEHAQGFLFFPGTNHIETLAVFQRCTN